MVLCAHYPVGALVVGYPKSQGDFKKMTMSHNPVPYLLHLRIDKGSRPSCTGTIYIPYEKSYFSSSHDIIFLIFNLELIFLTRISVPIHVIELNFFGYVPQSRYEGSVSQNFDVGLSFDFM